MDAGAAGSRTGLGPSVAIRRALASDLNAIDRKAPRLSRHNGLAVVADELREVERRLDVSMAEDFPPAADAVHSLVGAGGKRLRPALVILCAGSGAPKDAVYSAAMGVELIHTASLIHDDLLDDADTRRGVPTVHTRLGAKPAVLIGDYYFAKGAYLLASIGSTEIDQVICRTLRDLSVGELLEVNGRGDFCISPEEYLERARLKTASLLGASCECGAIVAGLDSPSRRALRRYGELLGLVFQIIDDVLDYVGDSKALGKPAGRDLRQGIATLPLIYALGDPIVAAELRARLGAHAFADPSAEQILSLVVASGGARRATDDALKLGKDAVQALIGVSGTVGSQALAEIVTLALDRRA